MEGEVLEVRQSKSRPEQGLVKVGTNSLNQDGGFVQISVGNVVVPRRSASSGEPQHDISQRSEA
ncbi:hypothetical protein [Rhodoferax koreensis]|uniref:hypothetical protein n=1 Tax=Rhodoferax koreensis TaxID=1842727 RepID=UPI0012FFD23B|nr:hypothetical protein [Rhodoferax koreense]